MHPPLIAVLILATVTYACGVLVSVMHGWMEYTDRRTAEDEDRRRAARRIIFCWAWPITESREQADTLRSILRDALGRPPHTDRGTPEPPTQHHPPHYHG